MLNVLWLDDVRNPFIKPWQRDFFRDHSVIWVRNYQEFVTWITDNGLPNIISFDHDLADDHYVPEYLWDDYQASKEYQDSKEYTEKTGYDCAKWLIEYCMDNNDSLPIWTVHSLNPVGADNIIGLLENYTKKVENTDSKIIRLYDK